MPVKLIFTSGNGKQIIKLHESSAFQAAFMRHAEEFMYAENLLFLYDFYKYSQLREAGFAHDRMALQAMVEKYILGSNCQLKVNLSGNLQNHINLCRNNDNRLYVSLKLAKSEIELLLQPNLYRFARSEHGLHLIATLKHDDKCKQYKSHRTQRSMSMPNILEGIQKKQFSKDFTLVFNKTKTEKVMSNLADVPEQKERAMKPFKKAKCIIL